MIRGREGVPAGPGVSEATHFHALQTYNFKLDKLAGFFAKTLMDNALPFGTGVVFSLATWNALSQIFL